MNKHTGKRVDNGEYIDGILALKSGVAHIRVWQTFHEVDPSTIEECESDN